MYKTNKLNTSDSSDLLHYTESKTFYNVMKIVKIKAWALHYPKMTTNHLKPYGLCFELSGKHQSSFKAEAYPE